MCTIPRCLNCDERLRRMFCAKCERAFKWILKKDTPPKLIEIKLIEKALTRDDEFSDN